MLVLFIWLCPTLIEYENNTMGIERNKQVKHNCVRFNQVLTTLYCYTFS